MFSGIVDSYKSGTQEEKGKSPSLKKKDKQRHKTPKNKLNKKILGTVV